MKKALIAGVASLAIAAMPVAGVFAADPAAVEDTLTVTVNESCTFARTTGDGNYTKTMTAGALEAAFGTSVFTANCNNGAGYKINAEFTDLAQDNGDGGKITYSAETPTANSGTWTAAKSGGNIAASNGILGERTTEDPKAGSTYTVTYKVSLHDNQAKGTYKGSATYTLVQNPATTTTGD